MADGVVRFDAVLLIAEIPDIMARAASRALPVAITAPPCVCMGACCSTQQRACLQICSAYLKIQSVHDKTEQVLNESSRHWEFALDQPGSAGPATLRYSAGFAAIIIAASFAVLAFRHIHLPAFPQFAAFHTGFVLVVDSTVAFLLFGQFAYRPLLSYALLGSAYLFSALVALPFLFSFPGALKAEGIVIGGSQSSVWVWHAWHIGFPLIVMLSLLVHETAAGRTVPARRVVPVIGWTVAAAVLLALLVAVMVTLFHDRLPVLITPERIPLTSTFYVVGGIAAGVTAASLAIALWAARRRSMLHIWLAVALTAFLGDAVASLASTGRYTVGWYFGRIESMFAATVLLLVFLGQINQLYRQLAVRISELVISNRTLGAMVEEKEAMVAELRQREEEIRQLAHFDPVTELPNRRLLMDRLNHLLAQGARHHHLTAVLFLDLDKFKAVNDRLGHETGDKLLHEVGARLKHCVRSEDTVSRHGGDEFVIVLPEISRRQDAETTAQKVLEILSEPMTIAGHLIEITASIGIAVSKPDVQSNAVEMLMLADDAMYAAKKAGRNRYCFAD